MANRKEDALAKAKQRIDRELATEWGGRLHLIRFVFAHCHAPTMAWKSVLVFLDSLDNPCKRFDRAIRGKPGDRYRHSRAKRLPTALRPIFVA
jgi:hypothetical protein